MMMLRRALASITATLAAIAPAAEPPTLGYVLQADQLGSSRADAVVQLAGCDRDWIVIDSSYDGSPSTRWSRSEIDAIRGGKQGRRVIAYISIGEAETYRSYWRSGWDANNDGSPDTSAPSFLLGENPDWAGNYRVEYWSPEWQRLVLAEIETLVDQGFDGLYLDIVDAFEVFEYDGNDWVDDRLNPATGRSYRHDMVAWVSRIASVAREKSDRSFAVVPQNGPQLLAKPAYREVISAVSVEDLFTDGNRKQDRSDSRYRVGFLKQAIAADLPVFVVEYASQRKLIQQAVKQCAEHRLSLLVTDRDLTTLGVVEFSQASP